jgi:hypothetical protein
MNKHALSLVYNNFILAVCYPDWIVILAISEGLLTS